MTSGEDRKYTDLRDEALLSLIREKNRSDLYKIIYNRYYPRVLDKCYSLLHNKSLSQEFAEDILTKAFENLKGFRGNASFSSWLYAITYNHCIDYLRKKKKLHYPEWNSRQDLPEIIDESETDYTDLDYERLMKILDMIHTEEKALLLMKYQDNISIRDISTALRVTESAAKMRIKRARARVLYLYRKKYGEREFPANGQ